MKRINDNSMASSGANKIGDKVDLPLYGVMCGPPYANGVARYIKTAGFFNEVETHPNRVYGMSFK